MSQAYIKTFLKYPVSLRSLEHHIQVCPNVTGFIEERKKVEGVHYTDFVLRVGHYSGT